MVKCFCALIPDKGTYEHISGLKAKTKKLIGDQQYLNDPPHITLFVGDYDVKNISFNESDISILTDLEFQLKDWLIFKEDPVTGKTSLNISLTEKNQLLLRNFQESLIKNFLKHNSKKIIERYKDANLTKEQSDNLKKYGYPFIGEGWIPHLSIASIDPKKFDKAFSELKKDLKPIKFKIKKITLNKIDKNDEIIKIIIKKELS